MLIDEFLPHYDISKSHHTIMAALPDRVYGAFRTADFGRSWIIKILFLLRGLPGWLGKGRNLPLNRLLGGQKLTLNTFLNYGFHALAEDPGRELLIGLEGRFWTTTGELRHTDAVRFREPLEPGWARAAFNFAVRKLNDRQTLLTTETRIRCGDPKSLKSFRRYWRVVGPFSGVIRRIMLRSIRWECR